MILLLGVEPPPSLPLPRLTAWQPPWQPTTLLLQVWGVGGRPAFCALQRRVEASGSRRGAVRLPGHGQPARPQQARNHASTYVPCTAPAPSAMPLPAVAVLPLSCLPPGPSHLFLLAPGPSHNLPLCVAADPLKQPTKLINQPPNHPSTRPCTCARGGPFSLGGLAVEVRVV